MLITYVASHLQASFPRDIQSIHLRKVGFIELDTVVRLPLPNPFTLVMKSAEVIGITVEAESGNLAKRILKQHGSVTPGI